jgi:hypothetical protein
LFVDVDFGTNQDHQIEGEVRRIRSQLLDLKQELLEDILVIGLKLSRTTVVNFGADHFGEKG